MFAKLVTVDKVTKEQKRLGGLRSARVRRIKRYIRQLMAEGRHDVVADLLAELEWQPVSEHAMTDAARKRIAAGVTALRAAQRAQQAKSVAVASADELVGRRAGNVA